MVDVGYRPVKATAAAMIELVAHWTARHFEAAAGRRARGTALTA